MLLSIFSFCLRKVKFEANTPTQIFGGCLSHLASGLDFVDLWSCQITNDQFIAFSQSPAAQTLRRLKISTGSLNPDVCASHWAKFESLECLRLDLGVDCDSFWDRLLSLRTLRRLRVDVLPRPLPPSKILQAIADKSLAITHLSLPTNTEERSLPPEEEENVWNVLRASSRLLKHLIEFKLAPHSNHHSLKLHEFLRQHQPAPNQSVMLAERLPSSDPWDTIDDFFPPDERYNYGETMTQEVLEAISHRFPCLTILNLVVSDKWEAQDLSVLPHLKSLMMGFGDITPILVWPPLLKHLDLGFTADPPQRLVEQLIDSICKCTTLHTLELNEQFNPSRSTVERLLSSLPRLRSCVSPCLSPANPLVLRHAKLRAFDFDRVPKEHPANIEIGFLPSLNKLVFDSQAKPRLPGSSLQVPNVHLFRTDTFGDRAQFLTGLRHLRELEIESAPVLTTPKFPSFIAELTQLRRIMIQPALTDEASQVWRDLFNSNTSLADLVIHVDSEVAPILGEGRVVRPWANFPRSHFLLSFLVV